MPLSINTYAFAQEFRESRYARQSLRVGSASGEWEWESKISLAKKVADGVISTLLGAIESYTPA